MFCGKFPNGVSVFEDEHVFIGLDTELGKVVVENAEMIRGCEHERLSLMLQCSKHEKHGQQFVSYNVCFSRNRDFDFVLHVWMDIMDEKKTGRRQRYAARAVVDEMAVDVTSVELGAQKRHAPVTLEKHIREQAQCSIRCV